MSAKLGNCRNTSRKRGQRVRVIAPLERLPALLYQLMDFSSMLTKIAGIRETPPLSGAGTGGACAPDRQCSEYSKPSSRMRARVEEVASIEYDRRAQQRAHPLQIRPAVGLPLGEDQQRIGALAAHRSCSCSK